MEGEKGGGVKWGLTRNRHSTHSIAADATFSTRVCRIPGHQRPISCQTILPGPGLSVISTERQAHVIPGSTGNLSKRSPHVISTERQRVEKSRSTPRVTFQAVFVPPAVLQHASRHVSGRFRSPSRAKGKHDRPKSPLSSFRARPSSFRA